MLIDVFGAPSRILRPLACYWKREARCGLPIREADRKRPPVGEHLETYAGLGRRGSCRAAAERLRPHVPGNERDGDALPAYVPNVSSEYPIPTANSQPAGITRTSSALFFTEEAADKLGVLTQNATITEYTLPEANSKPLNVTLGQDGNIWLTEFGGDRIAEFNSDHGRLHGVHAADSDRRHADALRHRGRSRRQPVGH